MTALTGVNEVPTWLHSSSSAVAARGVDDGQGVADTTAKKKKAAPEGDVVTPAKRKLRARKARVAETKEEARRDVEEVQLKERRRRVKKEKKLQRGAEKKAEAVVEAKKKAREERAEEVRALRADMVRYVNALSSRASRRKARASVDQLGHDDDEKVLGVLRALRSQAVSDVVTRHTAAGSALVDADGDVEKDGRGFVVITSQGGDSKAPLLALVDTGADVEALVARSAVVRAGLLEDVVADEVAGAARLEALGGATIATVGELTLDVRAEGVRVALDARERLEAVHGMLSVIATVVEDHVLGEGVDVLLGNAWLKRMRVHPRPADDVLVVQDEWAIPFVRCPRGVTATPAARLAGLRPVAAVDAGATDVSKLRARGVAAMRLAAQRVARWSGESPPRARTSAHLDVERNIASMAAISRTKTRSAAAVGLVPRTNAAAPLHQEADHQATQQADPTMEQDVAHEAALAPLRRVAAEDKAAAERDAAEKWTVARKEELAALTGKLDGWWSEVRKACDLAEERGDDQLDAAAMERLEATLNTLAALSRSPSLWPRIEGEQPLSRPVVIDIDTTARPDRSGLARAPSGDKLDALLAIVDQFRRAGHLELSTSDNWVSAVVMVKKPNGKWRLAIDYRRLNAATTPCLYPLPDVDELLRKLARHRIFCVVDLRDAFLQLPLAAHSRPLTAINVPTIGRLQFVNMPIGLRNASSEFQQAIENALVGLINRDCVVYVDDLVVFGDTIIETTQRLHRVVARLAASDVRVSADKVALFREEVVVLGRRVRHQSIAVLSSQLSAVAEYERPTTVGDLWRFQGMVNHHRSFLPGLGALFAPLVAMEVEAREEVVKLRARGGTPTASDKLTEDKAVQAAWKRQSLRWSPAGQQAFEGIKKLLASPPNLFVPPRGALHGRLVVRVDACTSARNQPGGLGGGVYYREDDGHERLVVAFSRTLHKAERRYAAVEVELLALIETLEAADWVVGAASGTEVRTDHEALCFLTKLLAVRNGQLARWAARLLAYDICIRHVPGVDNVAADAWSRATPRHLRDVLAEALEVDEGESERFAHGVLTARKKVAAAIRLHRSPTPLGPTLLRPEDGVVVRADAFDALDGMADGSVHALFVDWPFAYRGDDVHRHFPRLPLTEWPRLNLGRVLAADAVVFAAAPLCKLAEVTQALESVPGMVQSSAIVMERANECASRAFWRTKHELVVVGVRGNAAARVLAPGANERLGVVHQGALGAPFATKPDELYALMRAAVRPHLVCVDLFGRTQRPGWCVVGDGGGVVDAKAPARVAGARRLEDEPPPVSARDSALADQQRLLEGDAALLAKVEALSDDAVRWLVANELEGSDDDGQWARDLRAAPVAKTTKLEAERIRTRLQPVLEWQVLEPVVLHRLLQKRPAAEVRRVKILGDGWWTTDQVANFARQASLSEREQKRDGLLGLRVPFVSVMVNGEKKLLVMQVAAGGELAALLVRRVHQSAAHPGIGRTAALLRDVPYHVVGAQRLVVDELALCRTCAARKSPPGRTEGWVPAHLHQGLDARIVAATVNDVVHMDLHELRQPGGGYLLTIIDEFSRWAVAVVIPDKKATTVALAIMDNWYSWFGAPRFFVSDQGTEFINSVFGALCEVLGVVQIRTTPYHPRSNGVVERFHRTLDNALYALLHQADAQPAEWTKLLSSALMWSRALTNRSTGFSPAELVLGYRLCVGDWALQASTEAQKLVDKGVLRVDRASVVGAGRGRGGVAAGEAGARADGKLGDALTRRRQLHAIVLERMQLAFIEMHEVGEAPASVAAERRNNLLGVGTYVDVHVAPDSAAHDRLVLNPKLAAKWQGPWRIQSVVRGSALVLTLATDPLSVITVAAERVKRAVLRKEDVVRFERLYAVTLAQKKEEWTKRQVEGDKSMRWLYLDEEEELERPRVDVERVLDTSVVDRVRVVRVKWADGDVTVEPLKRFAVDCPQAWADWSRDNARRKKEK